MVRNLLTGLVICLLACPVVAQEGENGNQGPPRGRWRERGERGDRGRWIERMVGRTADDLELDQAQQEQLDKLMQAHRERMKTYRGLRRQLREAAENDDEQRVEELRAQLEEMADPRDSIRQVFDEIEPTLSDDQYDRLTEMRDEWDQRRQRMEREREQRRQYREMIEKMPEELKLDDSQREEFERLVEQRRDRMRARFQEMRPLWREMQSAREAGDDARVEELQQQMAGMRPDREQATEQLLKEIREKILKEDQVPLLEEYQQQLLGGGEAAAESGTPAKLRELDAREILHVARRVHMDREQRHQLRLLARDAVKKQHEIRRGDKEGQAKLAESVQKQIVTMLNDEQKQRFNKELETARMRSRSRTW